MNSLDQKVIDITDLAFIKTKYVLAFNMYWCLSLLVNKKFACTFVNYMAVHFLNKKFACTFVNYMAVHFLKHASVNTTPSLSQASVG